LLNIFHHHSPTHLYREWIFQQNFSIVFFQFILFYYDFYIFTSIHQLITQTHGCVNNNSKA
jgi:hypothetical protein